MDEQKSPCILQDYIPFRATALLPLTPIHNYAKQGNGYRWPHIALGLPVCTNAPAQTYCRPTLSLPLPTARDFSSRVSGLVLYGSQWGFTKHSSINFSLRLVKDIVPLVIHYRLYSSTCHTRRERRRAEKQDRIHDNPVAKGWDGAVMQKPFAIPKCGGLKDGPTRRGVQSRVLD